MPTIHKIMTLFSQLYPQGRAFRLTPGSEQEKLHLGIGQSYASVYDDSLSLLDGVLPDNDNFTSEDATNWERRLGIITGASVPLADRKLAIARKMAHPGNIKARQHYLYIQGQLQDAGFNVYVHENRFPKYPTGYETKNPRTVYGPTGWVWFQHGDIQHGDIQHGSYYSDIVVNSMEADQDRLFKIGSNLRCTFFVGGQVLGTRASISESRRLEFRQLILRLKPVQMVGFLFIDYV